MKSSKIKEYEAMSVEDLRKEEKALKSELFKLRFQHALNGLDNPKKMELVKKNIARVNTVITKKEKNI
ncbi:MAG: 50S ribosomal protein L29 [Clostridia bacterium]|jgi:ribosomal protein L29|nr:50S ribosomal protein L29 [Clostridia bacterium]CDC79454.1 50S ribosomal protein L29 [Clostridium sp. CAG:465]